eukprot:Rhum_TRINITY_DN4290_c0_g1::Rhum_TRINITY_DN4290_c0_g1_i1::g.13727::m.13727
MLVSRQNLRATGLIAPRHEGAHIPDPEGVVCSVGQKGAAIRRERHGRRDVTVPLQRVQHGLGTGLPHHDVARRVRREDLVARQRRGHARHRNVLVELQRGTAGRTHVPGAHDTIVATGDEDGVAFAGCGDGVDDLGGGLDLLDALEALNVPQAHRVVCAGRVKLVTHLAVLEVQDGVVVSLQPVEVRTVAEDAPDVDETVDARRGKRGALRAELHRKHLPLRPAEPHDRALEVRRARPHNLAVLAAAVAARNDGAVRLSAALLLLQHHSARFGGAALHPCLPPLSFACSRTKKFCSPLLRTRLVVPPLFGCVFIAMKYRYCSF